MSAQARAYQDAERHENLVGVSLAAMQYGMLRIETDCRLQLLQRLDEGWVEGFCQ